MRLSVQGCLILWLCAFSSLTSADWYVQSDQWGGGDTFYPTQSAFCDYLESKALPGKTTYDCEITAIDTRVLNYNGTQYNDVPYYKFVIPVLGASNPTGYAYDFDSPEPPPCEDVWHHEGREKTECGYCDVGYVDAGEDVAPRCQIEQPKEACAETGELYEEAGYCTAECKSGSSLGGICLLPPEENECTKESADYRGEVVIGYGTPPVPACGDFDQCSGDTPGQVGFVNGELRCIPEDYGVPQCQGDSITVIDEYGFVCEPLSDVPEEPETPEEPNTDTDGDGEPDEYQRENDPESVDKGLDKVQDGISDTNNKLDGTNKRLDKISEGIKGVNENLNEGLGTANQTLNDINDKLDGPDGNYDTSGLGDAPTFAESSDRLQLVITSHPTIQAVTTIPSIASNNTCPVWTIPATDYWSAMPIDSHCQILTDHRGLLSMLFIAVWTLAAVFVFLRA